MSAYIITHVPHSGALVPVSMRDRMAHGDLMRAFEENQRVCDWFSGQFITVADDTLVFPYARTFCDVERFEDDPLDEVGQGVFYTRTLDGLPLRQETDEVALTWAREAAYEVYREHHMKLAAMIGQAIAYVPVVVIDVHSYSDWQASFTPFPERPDICIGTAHNTSAWMIETAVSVFRRHGYSVSMNRPYEGAMVSKPYKDNADHCSIMFEVHKRLYLNEINNIEPRGFRRLQLALNEAAASLRVVP